MPEKNEEIYTGKDQYEVEGAGRCEYCKKKDYCTEIRRKGGCRVRRKREEREQLKAKIEMYLDMGMTPEQIKVPLTLMQELNIEYPRPGRNMFGEPIESAAEVFDHGDTVDDGGDGEPIEETVDGSPEE